jgi:hypothetical protein
MKHLHTLIHLKPAQIMALIRTRVLGGGGAVRVAPFRFVPAVVRAPFMSTRRLWEPDGAGWAFSFLNKKHGFSGWNMAEEPLWRFNLHYFDYLLQEGMDRDTGLSLMRSWGDAYRAGILPRDALHPYVASLRLMNWLKFMTLHRTDDPALQEVVAADIVRVWQGLEIDLQANHLFADLCALRIGCRFFDSPQFKGIAERAESLFTEQFAAQFGDDDGHYERSPMYHAQIVEWLLDMVNFSLPVTRLEGKLRWLALMSVGERAAQMNDTAANDMRPVSALFSYARTLGIESDRRVEAGIRLLAAGNFARVSRGAFDLIMDGGGMVPYQPGHMHAGALSFELFHEGRPVLVDPGCGTYLAGELRRYQRSTAAHSTVSVDGADQQELWGAFRVARRGIFSPLTVDAETFIGTIRGYTGYTHERRVTVEERSVSVVDTVWCPGKHRAEVRYHCASGTKVALSNQAATLNGEVTIMMEGGTMTLREEPFSEGFNQTGVHPVLWCAFDFIDYIEIHSEIATIR